MRVLPPWENALDPVAQRCAALLRERSFPDLSDVLVLLPGLHAARALRARIRAASGRDAFIGPVCHTPASLAGTLAPARRATAQRARLMLLDAVRAHPGLTGGTDPWTLVEALTALFGELADADAGRPLEEAIRAGYGSDAPVQPVRREAALVTTLWDAWCAADGAAPGIGDGAAMVAALDAWHARGGKLLLVAGLDRVPPILVPWLAEAIEGGTAEVHFSGPPDTLPPSLANVAHGAPSSDPPDAVAALATTALGDGTAAPLTDRAASLARGWPEPPVAAAFSIAEALNPEHEARTVDLQVRQWWLAGHRRIAVVTEDRKLARRVRALLARAGLALDDSGGWALSTTSAAAALERWLEAVEGEFRASPLLDLLKSPFLATDGDRDAHLAAAWQFEEGVVRHEQVGRRLDDYRRAVRARASRLPEEWGAGLADRLLALLDRVEHAAAPLLRHAANPKRRFAAPEFCTALRESLARLGLHDGFATDAAGTRVVEELASMERAAAAVGASLSWTEWRAWLGTTLERAVFREAVESDVALLTLADAAAGDYDAVIVAGADAERLPGRGHAHPFFNEAVRRQLGLETWAEQRAVRARRFERALAAAPRRVVTWSREGAQGPRQPSPWLVAMRTTYALAWGRDVAEPEAARLAHLDATLVVDADAPRPGVSMRPRPVLDRVPTRWSASAHQDIVDCPYRWFAGHRLRLAAPDPLREAMSKQDFGERVHRCLHAFHADVPGLPGPFGRPVDAQNRDAAAALLHRIGDAVLADQADSDFVTRAWLRAWRRAVPMIVEFEAGRAAAGWRVEHVERTFERTVGNVTLHGRIDRVETKDGVRAVLDYKTGGVARVGDVASGENVQLASYATGVADPAELQFVALADALKGARVRLAGVPSRDHADLDVAALVDAAVARLASVVQMLESGAQLPAWGDADACRWCRYRGLCRRDTWDDA